MRRPACHQWLVLLSLAVASCDEGPTDAPGPVPTRITIAPESVLLEAAGDTARLKATVLDQEGRTITDAEVLWWSGNESVATVDAAGLVTAVSAGEATVQARSGILAGSAGIFVNGNPERGALIALYHATNGPAWSVQSNWLSAEPLSEWYGIRTNDAGRVTSIALGFNNLSGRIPARLAELASLEFLDLEGNSLTGPIPGELGNLTALWRLDLGRNRLTGTIPASFDNLGELRYLTLQSNQLEGEIPAALGQLRHLITIRAAGNRLSGDFPAALGKLERLQVLELGRNRLTGSIPDELAGSEQLEVLDLGGNRLTGGVPSTFAPGLRRLYLNANELEGLLPLSLSGLWLEEFAFAETDLCGPRTPAFATWLSRIENVSAGACPAAEHDEAVLRAIYAAMAGPEWARQEGWLSDRPIVEWAGVETGSDGRVTGLDLSSNGLAGKVPVEITYLDALAHLDLSGNGAMEGRFPPGFANLPLKTLGFLGTGLCAPGEQGFRRWLGELERWTGDTCENPDALTVRLPAVYLSQVIQDRDNTVPLVAGRDALLRVLPVADADNSFDYGARATFYHAGEEVHRVTVSTEGARGIGTEVDESVLDGTLFATIPGEILVPGVEMVVELDPEGSLPLREESQARIPAAGRMTLDVRALPPLELTLVPLVQSTNPDSSVIHATDGITPESMMLKETRLLLPLAEMDLKVREPLVVNDEVGLASWGTLLSAVALLRTTDGASGHYVGLMPPRNGGLGAKPGWVSIASITGSVIAHELGHNLNLSHAPCRVPIGFDPAFPHGGGRIGGWGHDVEDGVLVAPVVPDVMSYCDPSWISAYHFTKALQYRLSTTADGAASLAATPRTKALILWGQSGEDQVVLESAFVMDAPVTLPRKAGLHRIEGFGPDGRRHFSLSFTPVTVDETGQGHFAFAVPVDPAWAGSLTRITLSGPDGWDSLDTAAERPIAVFTDGETGRIRRISRGSFSLPVPGSGMAVVISRGIPSVQDLTLR